MSDDSPTLSIPIPFVQARHYTPGRKVPIDWLVCHSMEASRSNVTALHVAQWFAGPNAPQASAGYCIDAANVIQCVRDEDVAWHAPGANDRGIGFEFNGYAHDSREVWLADPAFALGAKLFAVKASQYDIPVVFLDASALLVPGSRGITTHAEVTKAFHTIGGHQDPGPNYPMDAFLEMVQAAMPPSASCEPTEI